MTAHASPFHVIGKALPEEALCLSESPQPHVLLLGTGSLGLERCAELCAALDMHTEAARSHHDLPFRLHHSRPIAVLIDLPVDSRALAAALRCIAAYHQDLPIRLISRDTATALGTADTARELWGLSDLDVMTPQAAPCALMPFLFQAARARGVGRFMPIG